MINLNLLTGELQSMFDAVSPQAAKIKSIALGFSAAALGMLLLVSILAAFIGKKYKHKDGDGEPVQVFGNRKLEVIMIAFPLLLVIFFFCWSARITGEILPAKQATEIPDVQIIGHQWWWEVRYAGAVARTANEIHLPAGRPLLISLRSADVIHDWWVPALSGKMDMLPDRENYLRTTIESPGIYYGSCSEFCGQQHAWMRIKVLAQSPADYSGWLDSLSANANTAADSSGRNVFMGATCSSCHTIRGTSANGTEGPDLTHFASRPTMLTGLMLNNAANVSAWISDPQKIKPGAHMPKFIFTADSLHALVNFLEQLK